MLGSRVFLFFHHCGFVAVLAYLDLQTWKTQFRQTQVEAWKELRLILPLAKMVELVGVTVSTLFEGHVQTEAVAAIATDRHGGSDSNVEQATRCLFRVFHGLSAQNFS